MSSKEGHPRFPFITLEVQGWRLKYCFLSFSDTVSKVQNQSCYTDTYQEDSSSNGCKQGSSFRFLFVQTYGFFYLLHGAEGKIERQVEDGLLVAFIIELKLNKK